MSAALKLANPRRIKAAHRRRWKCSTGSRVYANDNPYRYTDPDGRITGVEDAAGFFLGAIINIAITVAHDEATSQSITRGEIFGAAVSGGIEGIGLVNAPESGGLTATMAFGGVAEAAGDAVQQIFDKSASDFSVKDVIESGLAGAMIGGVTHGIPEARIPGLSSGRNSMNAIGKALRTKIANGNARGMSMNTAMKTAVGSQAADLGRKAMGTSIRNNLSHPLTVTITCPASVKPAQPCG